MGNLPQCCCSNISDNNKNPKTFKNTLINLFKMGKDPQSSSDSSEDYEYFTPEEMEKIKDTLDYRLREYQPNQLKSSDLNYIYESGIIE